MARRIIFEDEEIRVVHRPGATPYTLLTFAAVAHRPKDAWIWAEPPIEKLDIEAIGVIGKRENWYPAASMRAAAPAIRPLLRACAVGYGYSMGGYAVLKYGRLLGLTHGLAVSPQTTIDPAEVPQDRRFHRFHDAALHGGMAAWRWRQMTSRRSASSRATRLGRPMAGICAPSRRCPASR